jgi:hypothetical protein
MGDSRIVDRLILGSGVRPAAMWFSQQMLLGLT